MSQSTGSCSYSVCAHSARHAVTTSRTTARALTIAIAFAVKVTGACPHNTTDHAVADMINCHYGMCFGSA